MRESTLYLDFFKKNFRILLLGCMVGLIIGIGVFWLGGYKFRGSSSLELIADEQHILERTLITDQAVVWMREVAIPRGYVDSKVSTQIYKEGPLMIKVEVSGDDIGIIKMIERIDSELSVKYGFNKLGEISVARESKVSVWSIFLWIGGGFVVGLIYCLIRAYLQKY